MIKIQYMRSALIASGLIIASAQVYSAGFQISESTVSGLGRAFAGAGVAGDDVADMFYNPASLFLSEGRQFQIGVSAIDTKSSFTGSASPFGGGNDDGGTTGVVPNIYYTLAATDNIKYGISITAPYGLATQYDANWAGRYQALDSELVTIDINPNVAFKLSDAVSVGAGISLQYAAATLSQARLLGAGIADGKSEVNGDSWAPGFNLGVMFTPTDSTRIGVGYRSSVNQKIDGKLNVTNSTGATIVSAGAEAEVSLPATFYLSAMHSPNRRVDLLASVRFTQWSSFQELRVKFDNGLPDAVTPQNWDDSTTISVGINYHSTRKWTLRAGIAADQSPVAAQFRTARIPDSDRNWLTLGASYHASNGISIDFGFANLTGDIASINQTTSISQTQNSTLTGDYRGSARIFGIQLQKKL